MLALAALSFLTIALVAQDGRSYPESSRGFESSHEPQVAGGTVTGRVICSDTQRPARFAQVQLQSVQSASGASGIVSGSSYAGFFGGGSGRTGADGSFVITGVAPGDYYATATAPGYIAERQWLESEAAAGEDPALMLARIPQVHVSADGSSSVTVTMERGGVIAGRAVWEDGSPASGVEMTAILSTQATLPAAVARVQSPRSFGVNATDDRGMFRLTGLPPGDYLLRATVQAGTPGSEGYRSTEHSLSVLRFIQIFAPGVFHQADAKPISVRAGDERTDARLLIDLGQLHTVSGHVGSAASGLTVASGRVSLADPNERSTNFFTFILPDGSFSIPYVPPGTYTLQVTGASTQPLGSSVSRHGSSSGSAPAIGFQPFSQSVVVRDADLTDLSFNLTPANGNTP